MVHSSIERSSHKSPISIAGEAELAMKHGYIWIQSWHIPPHHRHMVATTLSVHCVALPQTRRMLNVAFGKIGEGAARGWNEAMVLVCLPLAPPTTNGFGTGPCKSKEIFR